MCARAYVVGVACNHVERSRSGDIYLEMIVLAQQAFHSTSSWLYLSTCPNLEHMDVPTKPDQPLARTDFQHSKTTFWKEQPQFSA